MLQASQEAVTDEKVLRHRVVELINECRKERAAGGAQPESKTEPPPKTSPPPKTAPASAPYEDESHEDAFEHDGSPSEENKDRVKDKFVLLDVVATDPRLRGLPNAIMNHMVCRYANTFRPSLSREL